METPKLTKAQKEVYDKVCDGETLTYNHTSASAFCSYYLSGQDGPVKINQKVGDALRKSGLLKEQNRITYSEWRYKAIYTNNN